MYIYQCMQQAPAKNKQTLANPSLQNLQKNKATYSKENSINGMAQRMACKISIDFANSSLIYSRLYE